MTLTEFLLARIAEDEAVANKTVDLTGRDGWWVDGPSLKSSKYWVYATGENFTDRPIAEHIARHDPTRVLAECEMKRQLVHEHQTFSQAAKSNPTNDRGLHVQLSAVGITQGLERAMRHAAAVYADHPDYLPEWRP